MQRKLARENTFILIFESICKKDETAEEIFVKATEIRGLEFDDYVKNVFFGSYENAQNIEAVIEKYSSGWKKERISPVSMALLRLGCYEMMYMSDIPAKVSINEAIELAKLYSDDEVRKMINGVLDKVYHDKVDHE